MNTYVLPNGLAVKHANQRETRHLYTDIFEKRVYLQHGISLPENSVVIDAGANIGLFTLFVLTNCPTAFIHAFEPSPKTFEILTSNCSLFTRVRANNYGLGDERKEDLFVYLPGATTGSGYYDHTMIPKMKQRLRQAILTHPEKSQPFRTPVGEELLDYLLDESYRPEVIKAPVRTLSWYMDERQIQRVDLLKIDVEGKECAVLAGIRNDHWQLIQQVVVEAHEAHTGMSSAPEIIAVLTGKGFSVQTLPEDGLLTTIVYAKR